jgi:carbonic anhydrase
MAKLVTRRDALRLAGWGVAAGALVPASGLPAFAADRPNAISGDEALRRLRDGHARYVANQPTQRDFAVNRAARAKAQYPIAAVLACADSRVAPEYLFDQGSGELFVVRVAGNVANGDGLASLEFAVQVLGVPLILVLGHSSCGAISAAISVQRDNATLPGHLPGLIGQIVPAVAAARAGNPSDLVAAATAENVRLAERVVVEQSKGMGDLARQGKLKVAGGVYDLASGKVAFL